jgi:FlaA1/EpsC-like NDP-sugar epimerase
MDLENLLNRNTININLRNCLEYIEGKRVLVTGAGGSIGSEICRQIVCGRAQRLYLLGHGEDSIYQIEKELNHILDQAGIVDRYIVPIIGEIQDENYMFYLMEHLRADVVFHTAAHKHVPMLEANPVEAIKNNVFGTKNILEASKYSEVSKFIFISSDKSVEPVGMYGVSKALAEEIILQEADGKHRFLVVRFGNVIGSRGSVINLFKEQIRNGESLTITERGIKRFFMSIGEAVSLVLKIGGVGLGGELYILDMGDPISIEEIAKAMAVEAGKPNIQINYVGLRDGEKFNEKLFSDDDIVSTTRYPKILRVKKKQRFENLAEVLLTLWDYCYCNDKLKHLYRNKREMRKYLKTLFPNLRSYGYEDPY